MDLSPLLSPDNGARRAAEAAYTEHAKAHPVECAGQLAQFFGSAQPEPTRALAAVLLRRFVGAAAAEWPAEQRAALRAGLLHALVHESATVARKVRAPRRRERARNGRSRRATGREMVGTAPRPRDGHARSRARLLVSSLC